MPVSLVGNRIRRIRGSLKLQQGEFAARLKVPQSLVSQVETGRQGASLAFLVSIYDKFGISIDWLLFGVGEPYTYKEQMEDVWEEIGNVREASRDYYRRRKPIRVVGTASATADETIEWEEIENETTELGPVVAIRVHGDSMEPLARAGQCVLAIPDADLRDGDLYVLRIRRKGVYFKRVYIMDKKTVELQSVNPVKPQPSLMVKPEDITNQYRVVGVKFE